MATIYGIADVDPKALEGKMVGVLGYGGQGRAHAQNLLDSGVDVVVGLYEGSKSWQQAEADGLRVELTSSVAKSADVLMFCLADVPMAEIYDREIGPFLKAGQALLFAHGFNIHFRLIVPPDNVGVGMVAPKGPGAALRERFLLGGGLPAVIGVQQDPRSDTLAICLAYAAAIGCARSGLLASSFKEETETDLFSEQAVLCGGLPELIKAGYDTLVDAGYQPEAAYIECLYETKAIVDLLISQGLAGMRKRISDTAEWVGYIAGKAIVNDQTKATMRDLLAKVQDGSFAEDWINENRTGKRRLQQFRETEDALPIEQVGETIRELTQKSLGA